MPATVLPPPAGSPASVAHGHLGAGDDSLGIRRTRACRGSHGGEATAAALPHDGERGRCVAGRPHKHRTRCTRWVVVSSSNSDAAGSVTVRFSERVHGHKLSPESFLLALTPRSVGL